MSRRPPPRRPPKFSLATPEELFFGHSPDIDLFVGDKADKIDIKKTKRLLNNAKETF
jgi:hypothetical protein|nr:MAG TPA: hypothetical protein [Caudoviricetes sp.]DAY27651.1 MAG TPA: hypothetical protein [Caudoviricetes sp.]